MDVLFSSEADKTNDYYLVMGGLEARMLKESALTASQLINNNRLRIDFINNITVFIENKMEILSGSYPETSKKEAMTHLKEERSYLIHQENLIRQKKVSQNITIEIKQENNFWSYVVKGAFILGGVGQVLAGLGMVGAGLTSCATLVGCVVGVASMTAGLVLAIHGINSIAENSMSLFRNDPNYKWFVSEWYEKGAVALGYTKAHGDLVYAGVDIALSGYGLLKNVLKPDAWRLFHYLNNDFLRGYQTMTRPALYLEVFVDGKTALSASNTAKSM
ncbi:DUF4225 domain-containing protein [Buttiauxella sp. WJP83]|uniref:DUF4225 domain-containing protein n=1 Tax=Buttiauxella sp. WJP83 TaxID=2986951 RepID=UPI0022DDCA7B|nr:DUF4225 domain-containing protein [Buttiauxella sp. WJP83]WBM70873.1 DUF4225 domain-containing protein [Buttiauxella sp. WJP83]